MLNLMQVLLLTFLGAVGSYNFKLATLQSPTIRQLPFQKELYIGAAFYLLSIVIYILALKNIMLSVLLPETSLTYVWSMAFAFIFLKERITKSKIIGAVLIVLGFVIIATSV